MTATTHEHTPHRPVGRPRSRVGQVGAHLIASAWFIVSLIGMFTVGLVGPAHREAWMGALPLLAIGGALAVGGGTCVAVAGVRMSRRGVGGPIGLLTGVGVMLVASVALPAMSDPSQPVALGLLAASGGAAAWAASQLDRGSAAARWRAALLVAGSLAWAVLGLERFGALDLSGDVVRALWHSGSVALGAGWLLLGLALKKPARGR